MIHFTFKLSIIWGTHDIVQNVDSYKFSYNGTMNEVTFVVEKSLPLCIRLQHVDRSEERRVG